MNLDLRPNNGIDRKGMDCVWSFFLCPDSNKKENEKRRMENREKNQNEKLSIKQKQLVQIEWTPKTSTINEQDWDIL